MELVVIAVLLTFTGAHVSYVEGPENTLSVVGSNVTLKCLSPFRNCSGTDWQKYMSGGSPTTFFKGPRTILNTNVTDKDRYSVDNSSGCDLVIKNVQLKDTGRFICSLIHNSCQVTKTAYLIILETQPKCTLNVSLDDTIEGDGVQMKCEVTYMYMYMYNMYVNNMYKGTDIVSMNWKGVTDAPATVKNANTISRTYSVVAFQPEVPSFTCETSFAFEIHDIMGPPIVGLATNSIPNASCSTSAIKVQYSVRDVTLSPSYSYYPPGTGINCMAKGHPSPTFKWQETEDNGVWMDIRNENGSQFTTGNVSSKKYRCFAMNVVRSKSYNKTSDQFQVNNTEASGSFTVVSTTTENSLFALPIALGVGLGIVVFLLIIVICCCVPCCPCYKWCRSKDKDDVVRHQDHEMSPSSLKHSAVDRSNHKTGAPPVGEQESTYADLGEDREISEYASLEQGQKTEAREKVKVLEQESAYASLGEDKDTSEYESLEQKQKSKVSEKVLEQESAYASLGDDRDASEYASLEQRQKSKPKKKSKP